MCHTRDCHMSKSWLSYLVINLTFYCYCHLIPKINHLLIFWSMDLIMYYYFGSKSTFEFLIECHTAHTLLA